MQEHIMGKNNSTSNYQYNNKDNRKSVFPFCYNNVYFTNITLLYNAFTKMLSNSMEFNRELLDSFAQVYRMYVRTISEYNKSWKNYTQLDKILRSRSHRIFDAKFREDSNLS